MRVARVEGAPLDPPFKGAGFNVSYGRLERLDHRLIRLTTDTGLHGMGEIVRLPAKDTSVAQALEDQLLPLVRDEALEDLPGLIDGFREEGPAVRGLCLGLETAMLDLIGQASGMPLSALMGGPANGDVPALLGLGCDAPDEIAAEIHARSGPHRMIQVKLGVGEIGLDLHRIEAALAALSPGQTLLADFNGALALPEALEALAGLDDARLVWEEPCKALDENLAFAAKAARPVLFDQCTGSLPALQKALASGLPWAVAVKPFYLGGVTVARTARDMAVAAGMPCRIDGPWSGQVACAVSLHLALGVPEDLLLFSGDLTDPLDTPNDLIRHPAPGRVGPVAGPGIGPLARDAIEGEPI